jgi:hypothetical protein
MGEINVISLDEVNDSIARMNMQARVRNDSDNSLILAESLTHIESQLVEPMRPAFEARGLMSIDSQGSPWQDHFKYYIKRGSFAEPQWVDNFSDKSLPTVNASLEEVLKPVKAFAIAAVWSRDEVEQIMYQNANRRPGEPRIDLENTLVSEAMRAMAYKENEVLLFGDKSRKIDGFCNNVDQSKIYFVPNNGSGNSAWEDKTALELLDDLKEIEWNAYTATKKVERPNKMALSIEMMKLLTGKRMSADNPETVLDVFLRSSKFFRSMDQFVDLYSLSKSELTALRGFDASSPVVSRGLGFCYNDSMMVLAGKIPMPANRIATLLPDQSNPFGFKAVWLERIGGVSIKRSEAILPFSGHEGNA